MLKTLLKKQLQEMFQSWIIDRKSGKARSKVKLIAFIVLMLLLFAILGLAFFAMFCGLAAGVLGNGFDWLYFSIIGLVSIALGLFGSVFGTYALLYLPKDNEMLLSLPIPEKTLLSARLCSVYLTSLVYCALVWIPGCLAWWATVQINAWNILLPVLMTFVIALFVTGLSCILGWVVALIASRTKGKSYISVILTLAFLAAYYSFYFKAVDSLNEIVNHLDSIGSTVENWLQFSYQVGNAAAGSLTAALFAVLIAAAVAAVCFLVMVRTFRSLALTETKAVEKKQKGDAFSPHTPEKAMQRRELRHFTSVSTWMLNGGLGLVIMPVLAVLAIVKADVLNEAMTQISSAVPSLTAAISVMLAAAMNFLVATNLILPASVSLEGKSLWILQSLPLEPWEVIQSKERMGILLNAFPAALSAVILGVCLRLSAGSILLVLLTVFAFICLFSDFCLFLNLKRPNLNWSNEAVVIKQGLAATIAIFGGWIFVAVTGLAGAGICILFSMKHAAPVLLLTAALYAGLWLLLRRWLKTKGSEILKTL